MSSSTCKNKQADTSISIDILSINYCGSKILITIQPFHAPFDLSTMYSRVRVATVMLNIWKYFLINFIMEKCLQLRFPYQQNFAVLWRLIATIIFLSVYTIYVETCAGEMFCE